MWNRHSKRWLAGLWLMLFSSSACSSDPTAVSKGLCEVKCELTNYQLYVGETPEVTLTVTAAKDRSVPILKENQMVLRGALKIEVIGPDGEHLWGTHAMGLPPPPPKPSDFVTLEPGKSLTIVQRLLSSVQKPGEYRVAIHFNPTLQDGFVIREDLSVTYREIPGDAVVQGLSFDSVLDRPSPENRTHASVRVMIVKSPNIHQLLIRTQESGELVFRVRRLLDVDKDTRMVAVSKPGHIWISLNKGGELHILWVSAFYGQIVRHEVVNEGSFKRCTSVHRPAITTTEAAYAHSVLISVRLRRENLVPAHEIGHILLNTTTHADIPPQTWITYVNLMRSAPGANYDVTSAKRLTAAQEAKILSSPLAT